MKPDLELMYKISKRGSKWMAFKKSEGNWVPLLADYTLASSAIGVIEDQVTRDVFKGNSR